MENSCSSCHTRDHKAGYREAYLLVDRKEPEKNRLARRPPTFVLPWCHKWETSKDIRRLLLSRHASAIERLGCAQTSYRKAHVLMLPMPKVCGIPWAWPAWLCWLRRADPITKHIQGWDLSNNAVLFYVDNYESFSLLKKLITSKDCIGRVAEFMHDVLMNDICTFRHSNLYWLQNSFITLCDI